jgi:hypothetical protein
MKIVSDKKLKSDAIERERERERKRERGASGRNFFGERRAETAGVGVRMERTIAKTRL